MNETPKFYKRLTVDGCPVDIPFTDTVVSTRCRFCGKPMQIHLEKLFHNGEIDLEASVYCYDCSSDKAVN